MHFTNGNRGSGDYRGRERKRGREGGGEMWWRGEGSNEIYNSHTQ